MSYCSSQADGDAGRVAPETFPEKSPQCEIPVLGCKARCAELRCGSFTRKKSDICRYLPEFEELSAFSGQLSAFGQGSFFLLPGSTFLPRGRQACGPQ
jgi:hypothetical protein